MIKNDDILSILKQSDEDKTALMENILIALQKAETVFEAKKTGADELKEQSTAAEADIMNLLNEHVRRLETEKIELSRDVEAGRDALKQLDPLKAQIADYDAMLQKAGAALEIAMQEKDDANEKLVKIQVQWEKISGE